MQKALLAVLVAVVAAAAGYWLARPKTSETALKPAQPAAIDPPAQQSPPPKVVPETLPAITLGDRAGKPRALADFQQPILVINFWATWCEPCRREIPLLKQLRRERTAQGVEIIGIAVDFRDQVIQYADKIGLDYPLLIGEQDALDAIAALGLPDAFPSTVFVDAQRRIVLSKLGELHAEQASFILDRIHEVNSGKLELAAAKQQIAAHMAQLAAERAAAAAASKQNPAVPPAKS